MEERQRSGRRNPAHITRLLEQAGFAPAAIEEIPVRYRFADAGELWYFVSELRGPLSLALGRLREDESEKARSIEARDRGTRLLGAKRESPECATS